MINECPVIQLHVYMYETLFWIKCECTLSDNFAIYGTLICYIAVSITMNAIKCRGKNLE